MIRLYDSSISGNAYKARLVLHQLGVPFERIEIDLLKGEARTPEFLKINPNGQVPAVVLDDGRVLSQSGAILWYFADGTALLPQDAFARAHTLEWLCFEQNSHEPAVAVARFWVRFLGKREEWRERLAERIKAGYRAFGVMEAALARRPFLVDGRYGIADIALYAYSHNADEGGFDLAGYPAIRAWLARVEAQPGFVPMAAGGTARLAAQGPS
jgi:glutathione S-transferase